MIGGAHGAFEGLRWRCPPLVPEMELLLTEDVVSLWQRTPRVADGEPPLPYWAVAWVGGQALARYLLDHVEEVRERTVLDFGTGSGMCAIAAAMAGACKVMAADLDPVSQTVVSANVLRNEVDVQFVHGDALEGDAGFADVILGGDVCYEQPMAEKVLAWLSGAHVDGKRILVGDPGREYFKSREFTRLASYEVPTPRDLEGREVTAASVWTFRGAAERGSSSRT